MEKWHPLSTRRLSVQTSLRWNDGLALCREDFGFGVDATLVYWDGQKTQYTASEADWAGYEQGLRDLLKDPERVRRFTPEAKVWLEKQSQKIRALAGKNHSNKSNAEILSVFRKLSEWVGQYYTRMWLVFLMDHPLCQAIGNEIPQTLAGQSEEIIRTLSTPRVQNDAMRQRQELLEISLEKNPTARQEKLEKHARAFEHIPMYDFDHAPYSLDHFQKELEKTPNAANEILETKKTMQQRKATFEKTVTELGFAKESLGAALVQMAADISILRDYRDSLRQKNNLALARFFSEIGKRAGLSVRHVSLLCDEEIAGFLQGKISKKELEETATARQDAFLILKQKGKTEILSGSAARQKGEKELSVTLASVIRGTVGNPGLTEGPARIVHTNQDLHKVQDGDILIVHMTRQDFVPYMRCCRAIVADEGGVMCHAAIVARELGLPCIVGAKHATRVLKDGQTVRVDATKGTVEPV